MFESLSNFIVETIDLLFRTKTVPESSMYIAFLRLFDSLFKLENASKAAYKEFKGYADGTEIPTKTIFSARLYSLLRACQEFLENLKAMSSILALYNKELFTVLGGVFYEKTSYLEAVDIFLETCPLQGKEDFLVNYPNSFSLDSFASYDVSQQLSEALNHSWEFEDTSKFKSIVNNLRQKISKKKC